MQFNPPYISNIDDVLPHIKDNPAFIVVDKGWYKVIDYVYNHRNTFDNDYARECRGLKFSSSDGSILARPYHKFHNLGECSGYHTGDINLSEPHIILDKLDGSMVHTCVRPEDGFVFPMTRMGYTDVAKQAMDFMYRNEEVYAGFISLASDNPDKTFIFEYVGPNNRIVIQYEKEELILTGVRDIHTGHYSTYLGMQAYLARFGNTIPLVGSYFDSTSASDISWLSGIIARDEDSEGCIVRFEDGAMVKMKSEIYCVKHKSKELTESMKGVVQLIIDGTLDDVKPQLDAPMIAKLDTYEFALRTRMEAFHEGLRHILSLRKHMEQKEFALSIVDYPKPVQALLFMTRKSGDGFTELVNLIKKRYNKESDVIDLFNELEFPLWV